METATFQLDSSSPNPPMPVSPWHAMDSTTELGHEAAPLLAVRRGLCAALAGGGAIDLDHVKMVESYCKMGIEPTETDNQATRGHQ